MSSKTSRCHGNRKWESMMVVLIAAHRYDQLFKMHRAPFRTEPNCSAHWRCKASVAPLSLSLGGMGGWTEKQPFGEISGWNDQHHPTGFIIAHRWDGMLADSTCWIAVGAPRKRVQSDTNTYTTEKNHNIRNWMSDILNTCCKGPRRGDWCGASSSSIWQGFSFRFKMMWWRLSLWYLDVLSKLAEDRESRPDPMLHTHAFLSGTLELSIIHKEDILFVQGKAWRRNSVFLSDYHFSIYNSFPPHFSSYFSLSVPPSLAVSLLRHFNNSKWYIKVNEICHTSGHYDACQGFVSSVRWTAAAHQQPVLLPHHVEYWISKVLENTVAPLISSRHNLQRLTPHAFISHIIFHFTYYSDVWGDRLGRLLACLAARF